MRILESYEITTVYGGGDTPAAAAGAFGFPNQCPPGYTGVTYNSVSQTQSNGFGLSGTAGVTGVTTGASGTVTSAPPTVTVTTTQTCLPNVAPAGNSSGSTASGSTGNGSGGSEAGSAASGGGSSGGSGGSGGGSAKEPKERQDDE